MSNESTVSADGLGVASQPELPEAQALNSSGTDLGQDARPPGEGRLASRGRVPPKLYRIGEVVEYSGVSRQTIHNYTTMGLLRERRWTPGGHRLYDESAFERLDQIGELKAQNKTLEEIRLFFAGLDADRPE